MRPILTLRQYTDDLIVHSHDHAQLVFGLSGALDFEVDGRGSQVVQQSFVVVPSGFHHACGSANGSRCLVLDVPGDQWVAQSLGDHADASRRLLDNAGRLPLDAGQSQLVNWLAGSPVSDPVIAQQGAVLLLASLNNARPQVVRRSAPALCGAECAHRSVRRLPAASRRSGAHRRTCPAPGCMRGSWPNAGRRRWTTSAAGDCTWPWACCGIRRCPLARLPVGSATAPRVPSPPRCCANSAPRRANCGARLATKDDSLPTDTGAHRFNVGLPQAAPTEDQSVVNVVGDSTFIKDCNDSPYRPWRPAYRRTDVWPDRCVRQTRRRLPRRHRFRSCGVCRAGAGVFCAVRQPHRAGRNCRPWTGAGCCSAACCWPGIG